ncbi:uncharacterized protein LOC121369681 [Gigantopelta aegis]|uniref:uncharacterized protein LOC121369681 n=1 Tax=Gigantopelta aegis TaxID=1735272 RepID=UPI001B88B46D|nr:uncharacterized protein LOC121369681 [Gigantopelta aegis]
MVLGKKLENLHVRNRCALPEISSPNDEPCFDIIFEPLFEELSGCLQKAKPDGIADHVLSVAVFMLLVVRDNDIKIHKCGELIRRFYTAFLVKADTVKRNCPNYDLMKRNFPAREQSVINILLETINYYSVDAPTDAGWLYILPLLHFLRGDSEPFQTSSSDAHRTEEWWGLTGVEKAEKNIKEYTEGFSYYEYTNYRSRRTFAQPMEWSM